MPLKHKYDSLDAVPEQFHELYSERDGAFELTGVTGIKTQADVSRVQEALSKEREDHKATKTTLKKLGGRDVDDVLADLGRLNELETAAGGKLDDAKIDEIVQERIKGRIAREINPLKKQLDEAKATIEEQTGKLTAFEKQETIRKTRESLRDIMSEPDLGVRPEHFEDVALYAERELTFDEHTGELIVGEGSKVDAGLSAKDWLSHMLEKRPGWKPASSGANTRGSGTTSSGAGSDNPWSKDGWNITKQAQVIRGQGPEVADRMARAAGTKVGVFAPPE